MMHDSEEVKGFGVLRLESQQVMVATGRIREPAGLLQLHCGRQVRIRIHAAAFPGMRLMFRARL